MKQTMETFGQVIGSAEDLIFVIDPALLIQYVSRRATSFTGLHPEEMVGKAFSLLFPQNGHDVLGNHLRAVLDSGGAFSCENRIVLPDHELWMDTRLAPIRDKDGRIMAVLGISRDITERKAREETIARSRREWLRAIDSMPYPLAVVNQEYRFERVNEAMAKRLGVSVRDAVGLTCHELLHGDLGPPAFCPLKGMVANREQHTAQIHEEHGMADLAVSVSSLKDQEGKVIGCVYVARDMSKSEKAMAEKRRREEYMKLLMTSAEYLVLIQDEEGKYIYFSAMPSEGVWPWDIIGKTPYDLFQPETAAGMMERVKQVTRSQRDLSQPSHLVYEGETFHFHEKMSPVKDTSGHVKAVVTLWRRIDGVKEIMEAPPSAAGRTGNLTPREHEILQLLAEGHTNKQIAEKLGISKKTVETHRSMIIRKLDLHSTSALVCYAVKSGLF